MILREVRDEVSRRIPFPRSHSGASTSTVPPTPVQERGDGDEPAERASGYSVWTSDAKWGKSKGTEAERRDSGSKADRMGVLVRVRFVGGREKLTICQAR